MAFRVGDLIATLSLEDKLSAGLSKIGDNMQKFGRDTAVLSGTVAAIGAASVVAAMAFDKSLTMMSTLAGVAEKDVGMVRDRILELSGAVGKGPQELADAMMAISSTTSDTTTALQILEVAAKASSVGMGEAKDVGRALTAVINAYGAEQITAARAGDILTQAVKDGGAEASELAPVLANVIPAAAQLGISFEQVAASLATTTKLGTPAAEAVTQLSSIMTALLKPTDEGREALAELGMSYEQLRESAGKDLQGTLASLVEGFKDNDEAMSKVFGRVEALRGVLGTAGVQGKTYAAEMRAMAESTGALDRAHAQFEKSAGAVWEKFSASVKVAAIELGTQLVPAFVDTMMAMKPMMEGLVGVIKWFADAPAPIRVTALAFGVLVAAMAPLAFAAGSLISAFGTLAGAATTLWNTTAICTLRYQALTAQLWLTDAAAKTIAVSFGAAALAIGAVAVAGAFLVKTWADEAIAADELANQENAAAARHAIIEMHLKRQQKETETLTQTKLRLLKAKQDEAAAAAKLAPMTDAEIVAAVKHTKQQEMLKKALDLTGKTYTDAKLAEHAVKVAEGLEKNTKAAEDHSKAISDMARSMSGADIAKQMREMAAALALIEKSGGTVTKAAAEQIRTLVAEATAAGLKIPDALTKAIIIPLVASEKGFAKLAQVAPEHLKTISDKAEREKYGLPQLDMVLDQAKGLWTRYPDVVEQELKNATKEVDQHAEDVAKALAKIDARIKKFDALSSIFDKLGSSIGGKFGGALAGLGVMFGGLADHAAQAKQNMEDFGEEAMTTSQKVAGAAGALGAAIAIYKQGSESLNGAASAMNGAMMGAQAGAAFGPWGAAIGAVAGGLIGFFAGSGFRKMANEAGKVLGMEISEETAKAIKGTMKELGTDVKTASLLNLDKAMEESGRAASTFEKQMIALFDVVAQGGAVGAAGLEQLDTAFAKLVDEGAAAAGAIRNVLAEAFSSGVLTDSMQDFVEGAVGEMVTGSQKILEGLSLIGDSVPLGEMGTAAAQFFVAGFTAQIAEVGLVEALEQSGAGLIDLYTKLSEEGNVLGAAMLAPFVELAGIVNDETDPTIKGFLLTLQGMGEVFEGLNKMGFVTADAFNGLSTGVLGTANALSEAGVTGQAFFMALAPQLAQIIKASEDYGFEIDSNTQALIEQAEQAGVSFPTDPIQQLVELVGQLVVLMGGTLPEAMQKIPAATESAFNDATRFIEDISNGIDELSNREIRINVAYSSSGFDVGNDGGEIPGFAGGSLGFRDFGSGTPAMLHGEEFVGTRDQMDAIISTAMSAGARAGGGGEAVVAELRSINYALQKQASVTAAAVRDAVDRLGR